MSKRQKAKRRGDESKGEARYMRPGGAFLGGKFTACGIRYSVKYSVINT